MLGTRRYQYSSAIQKRLKASRAKPHKPKFHPINASLVEDMFYLTMKYLSSQTNNHVYQWLSQLKHQWPSEYEKGAKRSSWSKRYLTRLEWAFSQARSSLKTETELRDMDKVLLTIKDRLRSADKRILATKKWRENK